MGKIALPCGRVALVDDADLCIAIGFQWRAVRAAQQTERFYARATLRGRNLYLHRLILAAPRHLTVDHANGDGLDNRRQNLRLASRSQNNANRTSLSKSGFRGVYFWSGRFEAYIANPERGSKKNIRLGSFGTAEEAARAYDQAAVERFGEFARLNFPRAA